MPEDKKCLERAIEYTSITKEERKIQLYAPMYLAFKLAFGRKR